MSQAQIEKLEKEIAQKKGTFKTRKSKIKKAQEPLRLEIID